MTLGEFRKYTKLLPDSTELKVGYGDDKFNVDTFNTEGTNLILCTSMYNKDDKVQIYETILKIGANLNTQL